MKTILKIKFDNTFYIFLILILLSGMFKEFTFIFYKRYIKLKYARKYDIIPYFKIYKIFETKEYFYLYTDENHSLILSKDGFEIGTPRKFTEFIKKKCPLKYRNEKNWDNN